MVTAKLSAQSWISVVNHLLFLLCLSVPSYFSYFSCSPSPASHFLCPYFAISLLGSHLHSIWFNQPYALMLVSSFFPFSLSLTLLWPKASRSKLICVKVRVKARKETTNFRIRASRFLHRHTHIHTRKRSRRRMKHFMPTNFTLFCSFTHNRPHRQALSYFLALSFPLQALFHVQCEFLPQDRCTNKCQPKWAKQKGSRVREQQTSSSLSHKGRIKFPRENCARYLWVPTHDFFILNDKIQARYLPDLT